MEIKTLRPHALLIASPGMGHLIPILELGKRLSSHHGFKVTLLVVSSNASSNQSQLLGSESNPNLDVVILPPVDIMVQPDATVYAQIVATMSASIPATLAVISAMQTCPTVLIVDPCGTDYFELAKDLGMARYVFVTTNALFLSIFLQLPVHDKDVREGKAESSKMTLIPDGKEVDVEYYFPSLLSYPVDYSLVVRSGTESTKGDGFLVNTWEDLETTTLGFLRNGDPPNRRIVHGPIYAVGPLVRMAKEISSGKNELLDWLDRQPTESVMYVSFGSGGSLSSQQIIELAWGLELSGERFIWVVRPPMCKDSSDFFFSVGRSRNGCSMDDYLPEGFLMRTQDVGVVVPLWAPQAEVLSHKSTGGFLTHCGWNSVMEGILNGIPMIAWPLYFEQKTNAAMLKEDLKVAISPEVEPTEGIVGREEIKMIVGKIMQAKESNAMRVRVKELKKIAERALAEDGNGSSYNSLAEFSKLHYNKL